MDDALKLLEEKENMRYEVLKCLHLHAQNNGIKRNSLKLSEILGVENLSSQMNEGGFRVQDAVNYLSGEELVEEKSTVLGKLYSITHKGVKEIERSIQNPEKSTEHFSSQVIQIFNAPVGTVQSGNNNSSYVSQVNNIGAEVQDTIKKLKSLVGSLPENHQNDASEVIEDLQEEIANPTKQSRLKSSLITLWQLGKDVANFANSVSAVAQRFGIDLTSF